MNQILLHVIKDLEEESIAMYHLTQKERSCLIDLEFGSNNNCEIFGRTEVLSDDIHAIALSIIHGDRRNKNEMIDILKKNSIFNNKCILLWISLYSQDYKYYWQFLKTIENLRNASLLYLVSSEQSLATQSHLL